jgi:hypothetical protein
MPMLDGTQASTRIRSTGILVPIIAFAAYALKGDKERCLEHGIDDYLATLSIGYALPPFLIGGSTRKIFTGSTLAKHL